MPVSDRAGRSDLRRWHIAVAAVFAVSGMGVSTWLSRIPDVRADLHLTIFAMGLLSLGLSLGSVLGFTAAGRIAAWLPPRAAMFAALTTAAVGTGISGGSIAIGSQAGLAVGLAVLGFGTGVCNVVMNVDAVAIERSRARPVLPWFHAMFSIGGVIGAGLGAAAAAARVPVPVHLAAEAVCSVAVAVWAVRGVPVPTSELRSHADRRAGLLTSAHAAPPAPPVRSGWRDRRTLLIGVLVLGMSFANGAANDWISLAMVSGHHSTTAFAAITFWVFVMATTTTRLFGTTVLARWGRVRVVRVSTVLAALGIAGFILAPSPGLAICGAVLWGFGSALGFPIGMSAAGDDPRTAARNIGVVATIGYAASLAGPPLLGLTGDHLGLLAALVVPLVTVVAAGAIAGVVRPLPPVSHAGDRAADDRTADDRAGDGQGRGQATASS